jgi:uncharacterized membrane protein
MPQDDPTNTGDDHTRARLAQLERSIGELSARLRAIEDQLGVAQQQQRREIDARPFGQGATRERDEVASVEQSIVASHAEPVVDGASAPRAESATVEDYPFNIPPRADHAGSSDRVESDAGATPSPPRPRRDLETMIGGSLFNWLGIIAVTISVGFFLKYAFENEWIGATARVLLGAAAGCSVLALAERLRARGYRAYAHVLTGGGVLILYLSIYAARVFYSLIDVTAAFALMSVVTATAVLLSVRHDARSIAVLALIGGFMTPALLSTHVDNQIALFAYVAFLDAGVLAVAYFKRWRVLDHLAFVATALVFVGWALSYYEPWKDYRTVFFLTLFFLMFAALAVVHNVLRQRTARWLDITLALSNAALYFLSVYAVLEDRHRGVLGAFALAISIFYALLYVVARTRHRADRLLASAYVVAAVTMLTTAVGVQFNQHWITIGWATEAAMLTWLALRERERAARYTALAVFALATSRWLTIDLFSITIGEGTRFVPVFNSRALSCLVLLLALACATWLYRHAHSVAVAAERDTITSLFTLTRFALVLVLLTSDANDYFAQQLARLPEALRYEMGARVWNTEQLTLSLVWTIYAAALAVAGLARRSKLIRFAGLGWLAVTALKIIVADATYYDAAWHAPLFNQTFAAFVVFVAAVGYVAHSYARAEGIDEGERRVVVTALAIVGNLFAVAALSLEASGYFHKQLDERERNGVSSRDLRLARQLSLSLVWAIYGGAMLAFGHVRQKRTLRLLALALLAATTFKVFFFDLAELEKFYRIVSFIALGLVLLAVSFLYQQRQRRAREAEG